MKLRISFLASALLFTLGACGMTDWANEHMPVIGERCENWQCFTSSGQEQSKLNQEERIQGQRKPANAPDTISGGTAASASAGASATAPAPPLAPPITEQGAYVYVPRAPAPAGTTPFDGQMPPSAQQ